MRCCADGALLGAQVVVRRWRRQGAQVVRVASTEVHQCPRIVTERAVGLEETQRFSQLASTPPREYTGLQSKPQRLKPQCVVFPELKILC